MKKERDIKELLQIMLDNIDSLYLGLCNLVFFLNVQGLITKKEVKTISNYMKKNKPINCESSNQWFKQGEKEPRIEWLQSEINRLT